MSRQLAKSLAAPVIAYLLMCSPALAQTPPKPEMPAAPPAASSPAPVEKPHEARKDIFAEPVTLTEKTVIYVKGQANWGAAFENIVAKFKQLNDYLDKQKIAPTGPALTVYTQTDDTGFSFQAELPIAEAPKDAPTGEIAIGKSPAGKTLKFVHRGAFDTLDSTYEAITNYLDEKNLEAKDLFIEEYPSDPVKTSEDQLVVNIYVPLK